MSAATPTRKMPRAGRRAEGSHRVRFPGLGTFDLTPEQFRAVGSLLMVYAGEGPADLEADLARVFEGSPAWGTLVVPGSRPGTYRLADSGTNPRARALPPGWAVVG